MWLSIWLVAEKLPQAPVGCVDAAMSPSQRQCTIMQTGLIGTLAKLGSISSTVTPTEAVFPQILT